MIGQVVLTRYNNSTYRIDDVNFQASPVSTFTSSRGETMTYTAYYQTKYNLRIHTPSQPLLMARSKQKDRRADQCEIICLIPELCNPTGKLNIIIYALTIQLIIFDTKTPSFIILGLTEGMRKNFPLMKALKAYTQVQPANRIDKLMMFNQRLQSHASIKQEFSDWNMELGSGLVQLTGRQLGYEKLLFSGKSHIQVSDKANWDNNVTEFHMIRSVEMKDWVVIVPQKAQREFQVRNSYVLN